MEMRDIAVAAKTLVKARISSYLHPSAAKVKAAKKKVQQAKKKLDDAERFLRKVQDEWLSYKKETLEKIQENTSALSEINATIRHLKDEEKAEKFKRRANSLARRNRLLKMIIGGNRQRKAKWNQFKASVKNSRQNIGQAWNSLMKVTIG